MKLYQVEYLLAVGKTGSISKAADELMVSRPAVSKAIKDLEQEFGVSFFIRSPTGVVFTEAGTLAYEKCREVEGILAQLQTEICALKGSLSGERLVHIGISFTARCCILPTLAAFRQAVPDVDVKLTDLEESFVDSGMLNADFDLEIALAEDISYDGIDYLDLAESSLCFCCSKKHPLADRSHVSVYDIQNEVMCGIFHLEQMDNQMDSLFARHGLKPNVAYITSQVSFLKQMVRDNLCCSVKPQQSMENDPGIVTIPIDEAPKLRLRILWAADLPHNSALFELVEYFRRHFPKEIN